MRASILLAALFILLVESCKRSETLEPNRDRKALYQYFNGKYEIISATSSEPLDLNFDRVASVNLKKELPGIGDYGLEITISQHSNANVFSEYWPEPYFGFLGGATPKHYDPNIPVYYASQGVSRLFEFSKDLKTLLLYPEDSTTNLQRYPRPDSIFVHQDSTIEVRNAKEFYTTYDWKKVNLIVLYKRKYVY